MGRAAVAALIATAAIVPLSGTQAQRPLAPIDTVIGTIVVNVADFASIPDMAGAASRMMLMVDEPGTKRFFVNDMRGPIYSVSYDGKTVAQYVDVNDSTWGVNVQSQGRERGVQSFAFHPQFSQARSPGYGKFYTWADSRNNTAAPDFRPLGGNNTHHMVLHEWTALDAKAATYDGAAPRELLRMEHPYANHNGGMAVFNPLAKSGSADFGLLYLGVGDGGSGGDPQNASQNLANAFGKVFRIDPMGRNSANGKYGIPASNPFAGGRKPEALPEIYAYGVRNPQRFAWDPSNGTMYVADIGQNLVEEISVVTSGGNLGWNVWEGSYRFVNRGELDASTARSDAAMVYPVVEFMHGDPPLSNRAAVTGVHIFRSAAVPVLRNKVMLGDNPSGELFYFDADKPPSGGSAGMHRILLRAKDGQPRTLLQLIREQNTTQGKQPAQRADLRFGSAADGRAFLLNKADGTIRVMVP
jgi:hypothetical protein